MRFAGCCLQHRCVSQRFHRDSLETLWVTLSHLSRSTPSQCLTQSILYMCRLFVPAPTHLQSVQATQSANTYLQQLHVAPCFKHYHDGEHTDDCTVEHLSTLLPIAHQ